MHRLLLLFLACTLTLGLASCAEEGPGGSATINGTTAHHDDPIPDCKVYIRYGSKESPGTDPALYDDSTSSNSEARFSFPGLERGEYYVYAVGFDSAIGEPVRAGAPVDLKSGQTVDIVIPVTE